MWLNSKMSETLHYEPNDPSALRRQNRLLGAALALSVAVHAAAIAWLPGTRDKAQSLLTRTLEVVLVKPPEPVPMRETQPEPKPRVEPTVKPREERKVSVVTKSRVAAETQPVLALPVAAPTTEAALPVVPPSAEVAPPATDSKPSVAATTAPAGPPRDKVATAPAIFNAAYLRNTPPRYPLIARRNGVEGTVRLKVFVTREGRPADVQLDQSSGSAALDTAAFDAVKTWQFVPARRGQEAIESWVVVPVVFKLENNS
ncbi:MAG TPA: energy transducer TonB [Burkholderiales bacterium]|nr:energy transducer TonB [Burkholderiales bacterium]